MRVLLDTYCSFDLMNRPGKLLDSERRFLSAQGRAGLPLPGRGSV